MTSVEQSTDGIEFGTDGWRAPAEQFTLERVRAIGEGSSTVIDAETETPATVPERQPSNSGQL